MTKILVSLLKQQQKTSLLRSLYLNPVLYIAHILPSLVLDFMTTVSAN